MENESLEIKLVKSMIGLSKKQIDMIKALGLKKVGSVVVKKNNRSVIGVLKKMCHVLEAKKI